MKFVPLGTVFRPKVQGAFLMNSQIEIKQGQSDGTITNY